MTDQAAGDSTGRTTAFVAGLARGWQGRQRFVVLDDQFDGGSRFLRCLQAWRADPQRLRSGLRRHQRERAGAPVHA